MTMLLDSLEGIELSNVGPAQVPQVKAGERSYYPAEFYLYEVNSNPEHALDLVRARLLEIRSRMPDGDAYITQRSCGLALVEPDSSTYAGVYSLVVLTSKQIHIAMGPHPSQLQVVAR